MSSKTTKRTIHAIRKGERRAERQAARQECRTAAIYFSTFRVVAA